MTTEPHSGGFGDLGRGWAARAKPPGNRRSIEKHAWPIMVDEPDSDDSRQAGATKHLSAPTPGVESQQEENPLEHAVAADNFYQGVIAWVHWGRERGAVRTASGREIQFDYPFVAVVGEPRTVESLGAGMRVGFDVGQTSGGLRVTRLKIYD